MKLVTTKWLCSYDDCGVEHEAVSYGPENVWDGCAPKGWVDIRRGSSYVTESYCPKHRVSVSNVDTAAVDVVKRECDHERCRGIGDGTKCYQGHFNRDSSVMMDDSKWGERSLEGFRITTEEE